MSKNPFRDLPSVNEVLAAPQLGAMAASHERLVEGVRLELAELRAHLAGGTEVDGLGGVEAIAARVARRLSREDRPKICPVINATGIVLHTNLGRAPMAETAANAAYQAAKGYLNLEMDLETGKRSSRQAALREWVCRLTGAESATAVNNNAAATVIVLRAICQGKEAIVSRGQLIEIGGSFRIPDIMEVSGAKLREVGTTNITRLADYERAIGSATGALMRIHTSNYRIAGFTKSVSTADLAQLGKKHAIPVIDDIGSGALIDFARFGFAGEPTARDSVAAGADLVLFSGDKLMGGPQAGIIAGRKEWIQKIEKDPLMRAFRLDKMTLAALDATLRHYLNEVEALEHVAVLRMLAISPEILKIRAEELADRLRSLAGIQSARAVADLAFVGGGSLPDRPMPTWLVEVAASNLSDTALAHRLRTGEPAVVGRLREGRLLLDLRTIFPEQADALVEALRRALAPVPA
jgi:L-seryl-tRNA(Ser) seleniumtransferase